MKRSSATAATLIEHDINGTDISPTHETNKKMAHMNTISD